MHTVRFLLTVCRLRFCGHASILFIEGNEAAMKVTVTPPCLYSRAGVAAIVPSPRVWHTVGSTGCGESRANGVSLKMMM